MIKASKWESLFGFAPVEPDGSIEQKHCNLAYAIQNVTEEIVLKMAQEAKRITGSDYLCMAGGVALNCVANGKLRRAGIFKDIYIQPAAGDSGGALGAALVAHHIFFEQKCKPSNDFDAMKGAYLGPQFSDKEITTSFKKLKAAYHHYSSFDELCAQVSDHLDKGAVVGWFQGRMEFGPRALGNRSILGDARNGDMQRKLNLKIKYREGFRPFAPSVLIEDVNAFFDFKEASPYMLFVSEVKEERRKVLPDNFNELDLWERLYAERSDIQSITHLDFSARVQTVHKQTNSRYWKLINTFKEKTGYGLVVNTSFNVRGEPIVCTPEDAYKCFMRTEMDYLVVNDFLLIKTEQPDWENREKWTVKFKLD